MMKEYKLSIVSKISLAGIFIVLVALFQKVFAINYIPIVPFLRLSFGGPALIIFSSILLGPWFGMLIGAASDLLGFLIFDPKTMSPYPMFQITFIYAMLGFASYFIYKWIKAIKSKKGIFLTEMITFVIIFVIVTLFVTLSDSIELYRKMNPLTTEIKIAIPVITFALLAALFLITYFIEKHFKNRGWNVSVYHVSFFCFITELLVMLLFGSLMKYWGFQQFYPTPLYSIMILQLIVGFFNIPFNTFIISYLMVISDRIIGKKREN